MLRREALWRQSGTAARSTSQRKAQLLDEALVNGGGVVGVFFLGQQGSTAHPRQRPPQSWSVKETFRGQERGSLGRQIGSLPQESIRDDELMISVARMRPGTISHSTQKPAAISRGDSGQLVMAGAPDVA